MINKSNEPWVKINADGDGCGCVLFGIALVIVAIGFVVWLCR